VLHLNHWGKSHIALVEIASNSFVYLAIVLSAIWLLYRMVRSVKVRITAKEFAAGLISKGVLNFAIPVGAATVLSEVLSRLYLRERPFVSMPGVTLLFPHSADGGMPSHHMVFMAALSAVVFFYDKLASTPLIVMTVLSGIARVAAGIHYPTDLIAGIALGWFVPTIFLIISARRARRYFSL